MSEPAAANAASPSAPGVAAPDSVSVSVSVSASAPVSVAQPDASLAEVPPVPQDAGDDTNNDDAPPAAHIPMASRLSLVSWGDGSAPSFPDIDDSASAEGDADVDDGGSGSDLGIMSTTTSLRSSIYDYVEENGRTYHRYKEGKYPLPNDIQEQARLDLQHAIFLLMARGKAFLAPIDKPKRVLDFATGTGIWAIEFALEFPDAHVVGTDLSPIQPAFVPANCTFEVDDAEDEWSFDEPFDFIHGRALVSCFRNPATVIRSAFNHLAEGGWLELQDGHFPIKFASPPPANCVLSRYFDLLLAGAARAGRPWTNTRHYKQWMEEAGLEDVVERRFYWPVSPWPRGAYYKTLGAYVQQDLLNGIEGLSLKLLGVLGWSFGDIQQLLVEVRRDLLDTSIHAYVEVSFLWGRKPVTGEPRTASGAASSGAAATETETAAENPATEA
ncbi:hypothetical protein SCUCBS95973_009362 [Sporothrix curviconia]|uniref:S-adenosyl-L-methionine-dependent methyltransferase n=1 Tax=Sporothrix curviconia TaxID=1260050 RepID=A0ABP0CUZ4_9PEZI